MPGHTSLEYLLNHIPEEKLEKLLEVHGVLPSFIDYSGHSVMTPLADRLLVLEAMGLQVNSEQAVDRLLAQTRSENLQHWVKPVMVAVANAMVILRFTCSQDETITAVFHWRIDLEAGASLSGEFRPCEYEAFESCETDHGSFASMDIPLAVVPAGYHQLYLHTEKRTQQALIIAAPERSHEPRWLLAGRRLWGLSVQLYTLRSARNLGIGDFADLYELIRRSAAAGADFVLLNPLHALHFGPPGVVSPYSPSDRRFLNPLYIAPDLDEDFTDSADVAVFTARAEFRALVRELEAKPDVDYPGVTAVKFRVFELMFRYFQESSSAADSARAIAFRAYVEDQGKNLSAFAACQAELPMPGVAASEDPDFHCYLQWLAERQLFGARQLALAQGMQVGIIGDLAVGSYSKGCEVTTNAGMFCLGARIGAPPDDFNPMGQNWGLPPLRPDALEASGFRHFITLLRENMRICNGLRIDHVMSLMRLWWCPGDGDQSAKSPVGAYVRYPVDILFAILRLESERGHCLVIGEDLGVVPPEIRRYLDDSGLLSNSVFYFEKYDGVYFRKPEHYPQRTLAFIANHDVPTLKAWWNLKDLALRERIALLPEGSSLEEASAYREHEKRLLLQWLDELSMLPQEWQDRDSGRAFDTALASAIFRACGATNAQLVSVQLDDLAGLESPVNIPGTDKEYPNWRRKLPVTLEELFESADTRQMLAAINETRDKPEGKPLWT